MQKNKIIKPNPQELFTTVMPNVSSLVDLYALTRYLLISALTCIEFVYSHVYVALLATKEVRELRFFTQISINPIFIFTSIYMIHFTYFDFIHCLGAGLATCNPARIRGSEYLCCFRSRARIECDLQFDFCFFIDLK